MSLECKVNIDYMVDAVCWFFFWGVADVQIEMKTWKPCWLCDAGMGRCWPRYDRARLMRAYFGVNYYYVSFCCSCCYCSGQNNRCVACKYFLLEQSWISWIFRGTFCMRIKHCCTRLFYIWWLHLCFFVCMFYISAIIMTHRPILYFIEIMKVMWCGIKKDLFCTFFYVCSFF